MEADEDLAPLMQSRRVREAVVSDDAEGSQSEARQQMRAWREKFGTERYRPDADAERNLIMLTSLADESHELMRRDLSRQGDWLVEHLFSAYPDDEVLLVLVDPADGSKVFTQRDVAGFYEHSKRRLVAQGTGFTLRHEYVHALHYGDMERRQQLHAFWVLEGLAALFEYYDYEPDGSITFLACAREEQMQRLLASSSLIRWRDLFSMSQMNFVAKGRNTYAHARSIFQFLAERGHLDAWYRAYVETFDEDSTGAKAFEIVFGQPIERIERRWQEWLRDRPRRPYALRDDQMALGIEPRPNENHDGVKILNVLPDTPAADAGLRRGDVIIAIDGETTPDFLDLRYRLMRIEPGASITIRYRRDEAFESVVIRPQRLSSP
ncbi:MAG: PDZ domain-containing protein [Phycisphaerales bacterium]|nr:MAG: PDZ domain-containing protein [Phycisphaerales bacterium]